MRKIPRDDNDFFLFSISTVTMVFANGLARALEAIDDDEELLLLVLSRTKLTRSITFGGDFPALCSKTVEKRADNIASMVLMQWRKTVLFLVS